MIKLIRQGDLALSLIKELPKNLQESKTKTLMTGSHNHNHIINKGKVYFEKIDDYIIGYLVAKGTELDHIEHGKLKIDDGIYEIRKQQEETHEGLSPVID